MGMSLGRWLLAACVAMVAGAPAFSQEKKAPTLSLGDRAPAIQVKAFLSGEPVTTFEKGKVYVVEFWATWCGPCRTTIPHLTELQAKHKDATIVGVSIWEDEPSEIKPFVEEMGDKMAYRVAVDSVPEGGKPNDGAMASKWMDDAGEEGLPTAFLINGDGKVAWIGHPMELDKPLAAVLDGTYDLTAAIAERKAELEREKKIEDIEAKIAEAIEAGNLKKVVTILDEAFRDDPKLETLLGPTKFVALLAAGGDTKPIVAYGKTLADGIFQDNADALNEIAWSIVDPEADQKPDAPLIDLALQAARRADTVAKGENPFIADTLAKALYDSGDPVQALAAQERALRLAEGTPLEDEEAMLERLQLYRKAVIRLNRKSG